MSSFCRTCSRQIFDDTSHSSRSKTSHKHQLTVCIPKLDLRASSDVKLCKDCAATLDIIYNFKVKCREVDAKVEKHFSASESSRIKLENSSNDGFRVCRICFVDVVDGRHNFLSDERFYKRELTFCVPEMDLRTKSDVTLCEDCRLVLDTFYKFKMKCLDVEKNAMERLKSYSVAKFEDSSVSNILFIKTEIHNEEDFTIKQEEIHSVKEEEIMENLYESIPNVKILTVNDECANALKYQQCVGDDTTCRHIGARTGEQLFKCTLCEYSTVQNYDLDEHMHTKHTDEQLFKCLQCEYSTVNGKNLKRHIRRHTFKCSQCEYTTTRKYTLDAHMQKHADGENY